MENTDATESLKQLILLKETEHQAEGALLKMHFQQTYESLKPINLIRNTLKTAAADPDVRTNLVTGVISYVSGMLAKKIVAGNTHNPIKKIIGGLAGIAVSNLMSKNSDGIKNLGNFLLNKLVRKNPHEEKS